MLGGCVIHQSVNQDLLWGRERITKSVVRNLLLDAVSVVLLMEKGELRAIGRLRRSKTWTTFDRLISIDLIEYEFGSLPLEEILESVPPRFRIHVQRTLTRDGKIPRGTWGVLRTALKTLQPDLLDHIEDIEEKTYAPRNSPHDLRFNIPALEKDAVSLALRMAGIGRQVLESLIPSPEPVPFLVGLAGASVIEDQIINGDLEVFGDWSRFASDVLGTKKFTDGKQWVTVMNVNRTRVESTVGVDLIYYHHRYQSYVLVQYKRLLREPRQDRGGAPTSWVYRPSRDRNFGIEIDRMTAIQDLSVQPAAAPTEYRLNPGPCFVKFCEPDMKMAPAELAKGMYLSLDFLKLLLNSSDLKGPRDGTIVSYDTVRRYLSNRDFVSLVQNGWIGSTGIASSAITEFIRSALGAKRSVLLASSGRTDR